MKLKGDCSIMIDVNSEYAVFIQKASDTLYIMLEGQKKTHSEVVDTAEKLLPIVTGVANIKDNQYYKEILNAVVDRYEVEVGIKTYAPDTIAKDKQSKYWLNKIKPTIPHPFFDRYKQYLRADGFAMKTINNIELTCEEILSYCANPKNVGGHDKKRGLVVGDVQSGKTANYLGLINMAYDYGYKIVVLLAGTTNSLRLQTQKRTDSGVIGAKSDSIGNSIEYIGVGENTQDHFAIPFTNQANDFKRFIQANNNIGIGDLNKPVVLVVKKVKSILESVGERLQSALSEKGLKDSSSILIIDDEADNASVNTRSLEDPTTINKAIRAIFNKFPIASYVGYTATPFANIFINPYSEENNLDLFPSDFIVQLHSPDTYFGGRKVFPNGNDELPHCLWLLNEEEEGFLPVIHNKEYVYRELAESLKQAIREFAINNVIRTLRNQPTKHRSMMINITRYNDVQERIRFCVEEYLNNFLNAIDQLSSMPVNKFIENSECRAVYDLYRTDFYESIRNGNPTEGILPITWEMIQAGLSDEVKRFTVAVINSRNGKMTRRNELGNNARFDYEDYKYEGARVIAIGGMVLSRGLTLEGLMTSYYSRNAGTYDTLLQMCRWFGYRPKYEDLCRIYLTQENIDRFQAVLDAVEDVKEQFAEMKRKDKTPSDFGLMVRESPDTLNTTMLITARNKMHGTDTITCYLNYGGVYADTSKLSRKVADNKHNFKAVEEFVKTHTFCSINDRCMATDVSKFDIADFIKKLSVPYVNKKFDTEGLSDYIERSDIFTYWDVVIAKGDSPNPKMQDCFGLKDVSATLRSFHSKGEYDQYIRIGGSNNRVLDPGIFNAGFDSTQKKQEMIKEETKGKDLSALDYLEIRSKPILVIYPIDLRTGLSPSEENRQPPLSQNEKDTMKALRQKIKEEIENNDMPLVAFAFGFPKKESEVRLRYRANIIKLDQMNSDLETDDDGEGEEDTDD